MKLLSTHFAAPAILAVLSITAGCSSDPATGGSAGSSPGGASSGGKAGSAGSSGGSVSGGAGGAVAGAGGSAGSISVAGSAGAGTAGAGTAGSAGGAAIEASFATVKGIIMPSCFGNGCHSQEGNPMILEINDDAKLYATLTTHVTQNCGKLVNVASPADSALVKVLKASCNGTPRMPFQTCQDGDTDPDSPCIQPDKIAAIQAWIAKGAPQQ
jgi:hypothetical protein